jgi:NADPH-dependent 2,4-dienoyl-CoA reductase/sulfur reductase-like enzyme
LRADWLLGTPAVGLDAWRRTVTMGDGARLRYDALVVATGVAPRRIGRAADGLHVLRTIDDALALSAELDARPKVVVIGAGPLGAEFAAAARLRGSRVTVVEPAAQPLLRQLGPVVGRLLAELHSDHGVDLRLSVGADEVLTAGGRVRGVRLSDGSVVEADLVLTAVGSVPNTGWLEGSGLTLGDGVVCDERCRAAPGVFAAGDVARWRHPTLGGMIRIEHRMNANEQAITVARNILGGGEAFSPIPYFWTDHYDTSIHVYGTCPPDAEFAVVHGSLTERRFAGLYGSAGRVTGVLTWNCTREARRFRPLLARPHDWAGTLADLDAHPLPRP